MPATKQQIRQMIVSVKTALRHERGQVEKRPDGLFSTGIWAARGPNPEITDEKLHSQFLRHESKIHVAMPRKTRHERG